MALKLSTGARDHLLITGPMKTALDGGVIRIYNGTPPATADAALSGNTLLCTISDNSTGAGLNMNTVSAGGVLGKSTSQVWAGSIVANGTASFYRFVPIADDGTLSTTAKRIQGTVGTAGADLNFSSVTFVSGNSKSIDTFDVAQPTA